MNSEGRFWFGIWSLVAAASVVIAVSIATVTVHSDRVIMKMAGDGVNPIAARCAMSDYYGDDPTCVAIATKGR